MRNTRFENDEDPYRRNKQSIGSGLNTDNWANILDQYLIQPICGGEGRVLVKEDAFKSRFDCIECKGKGHTGEVCTNCNGTKIEIIGDEQHPCRACTTGQAGLRKTYGFKLCSTCNGRQGTIIVPDESQRNSTMGDILAISKAGITTVKVNDKVLFSNYGGQPFKFLDQDLRIIVEKDLLGIIKQLKENVDGLREGTYADLDNVGMAHNN